MHIAHIAVAKKAAECANLDELVFVPAHRAPLRDSPYGASDSDRLNMLEIALKKLDFPWRIECCELRRGGVNYSVDTLEELKTKYPHREFFWIIGSDHIAKLKYWKDAENFCASVTLVCVKRPGYDAHVETPANARVLFADCGEMPHSSSQIRRDLASGGRGNFMLDSEVLKYILGRKLYGVKTT